jgi:hypothetical protein
MGVEPVASPNMIENNRPPLPYDKNFNLGDMWLDRSLTVPDLYVLVCLKNNYAVWIKFSTSNNTISSYVTDAGTATPVGNLVSWIGKDSLQTIAAGSTVSIDFRPLAMGYMLVSDGTTMGPGRISSPNDTIAVTLGDGTVDLVYKSIDGIHGDIGDAVRSGNLIAIIGGINIATHGIANTVFVVTNNLPTIAGTFSLLSYPDGVITSDVDGLTNPTNGLPGQILISSTAGVPLWRYITSAHGTLNIDSTDNQIDITNRSVGGISEIDGDAGTAVAIANNIKIKGGTNIVTAAVLHTVTIDLTTDVTLSGTLTLYGPTKGVMHVNGTGQLFASKGTLDGQTLIASTGSVPVWNRIVAGDSTMTITNTAYGIDLKSTASTGMRYIYTDNGSTGHATVAAGVIKILGGTNITTTAFSNNSLHIDVDNDVVFSGSLAITGTYAGLLMSDSHLFRSKFSVISPASPQPTPIGGGTSAVMAFITSAKNTITFTQTSAPRTLNLENNGSSLSQGNTVFLATMSLSASTADLNLGTSTPKILKVATESFDPSDCWTNGTTYTAKIDGKYNFQTCYNFQRAYDGPYATDMKLQLVTSNRSFLTRRKEVLVKASPTSGSYLNGGMTLDVCCDLDIGDIAQVKVLADYNGVDGFWKLSKGDGTFVSAFYVGR